MIELKQSAVLDLIKPLPPLPPLLKITRKYTDAELNTIEIQSLVHFISITQRKLFLATKNTRIKKKNDRQNFHSLYWKHVWCFEKRQSNYKRWRFSTQHFFDDVKKYSWYSVVVDCGEPSKQPRFRPRAWRILLRPTSTNIYRSFELLPHWQASLPSRCLLGAISRGIVVLGNKRTGYRAMLLGLVQAADEHRGDT